MLTAMPIHIGTNAILEPVYLAEGKKKIEALVHSILYDYYCLNTYIDPRYQTTVVILFLLASCYRPYLVQERAVWLGSCRMHVRLVNRLTLMILHPF